MIAEAALALHWLNPLAWVAARRLRIEREHACDDAVVSAGARPSDYAEELLSLARGFHAPHRTSRAAVAMARPAHLAARIRTLLQDRRPRTQSGRRALALASLTSVMVSGLAAVVPVRATVDSGDEPLTPSVAPAARRPSPRPDETTPEEPVPALPIPSEFTALVSLNPIPPQEATCGMATSGWERSTSNSNDDEHRFRWSKPGCDVDVRMEGDVEFSTSFRDVARLGRGAFLRIEEEEGGTQRRLDVTPGTDGAPLYAYRVNGNEQPFDAAARAWYEGMLLQIFRRGGFMAEERVAALLASGGAAAVFQELEALSSDYVFATYTRELMEQATLTAPQTVGLVGRAAARVDSDYYMAEILGAVADRQLSSDDVLDAFIAATSSVDSDHYRTEVLSRALDREDLSPARVAAVLESASGISSDFYLAQLLGSIAGRYALEPALRGPYLRAVESIESDHYRTEVLSTLLGRNDLDVSEMAVVLRATAGVDSDHYRTQILAQIATRALPSDALRAAYLEAADGIESDHYRSEALGHLLETSTLSQAQMTDVIRAAAGIESDHYKSALLVEIVRRNRLEGAARDAYMDALESIGSQTYRGAAAEALLRSDRRG
jgi:hypothetical protein